MADRDLRPQLRPKPRRKTAKELEKECLALEVRLLRIIESAGIDRDRAIEEARAWLQKRHPGWSYRVMAVYATMDREADE